MIIRHGDVILRKITKEEYEKIEGGKEVKSAILALGETTGHKHVITAPKMEIREKEGRYYLWIQEEGTLTHEEHGTLVVTPSHYRQEFEREKDWFSGAVRKVID